METIKYNVNRYEQGLQECTQTNVLQLLHFKGINKSINEVLVAVPIHKDAVGTPLGSSLGHIATYLVDLGFLVTIHTVDVQIFDRTWATYSNEDVVQLLKKRQQSIKHAYYGENEFNVIFDGYIKYLEKNGKIVFPVFSTAYLYNLLKQGPFLATINYEFLNSAAKCSFSEETNSFVDDVINGNPSTHVITVIGYENDSFIIADPDPRYGGIRTIEENLLVGSLYLAETDYDCMIISIDDVNR